MPVIEQQLTVNASPDAVFQYLADFPRHSEWAAHPLKLTQTSSGPVAVGTTFDSVGHMMNKDFHDHVKVTELEPGHRIGFEVESGNNYLRYYFDIHGQVGSSTSLTKGVEALKTGFPFVLIAPILAITGQFAKGVRGDLERIKAKVEAGA